MVGYGYVTGITRILLCLNQMFYYALYLSYTTPTQKLFCLHVFHQAGPPQRVVCLASKWKIALSVFLKSQDIATRYHIGSRIKVSQPYDY